MKRWNKFSNQAPCNSNEKSKNTLRSSNKPNKESVNLRSNLEYKGSRGKRCNKRNNNREDKYDKTMKNKCSNINNN